MLRHMGKSLRRKSWKLVIVLPCGALREAAFPMGAAALIAVFLWSVGSNAFRELAYGY